jgi:uncharacterized membrane protein
VGFGLEYSLTPDGGWVGWFLGVLLIASLVLSDLTPEGGSSQKVGRRTMPIVGIYLVLTLVYFSFSAPAVITRWTEANYTLVVMAVSVLSLVFAWVSSSRPEWLTRLSPSLLVVWNLYSPPATSPCWLTGFRS